MSAPSSTVFEFDGFRMDAVRRVLSDPDGRPVFLKAKAFETLLYLVEHAGQLCDKRDLMAAVWPGLVVEENNLNQNISALRRALGERPGRHKFIVTEPGRGYRFVTAVRSATFSDTDYNVLAGAGSAVPSSVATRRASGARRRGLIVGAAAALLLLAMFAFPFIRDFVRPAPSESPAQVIRFGLQVPPSIRAGLDGAPNSVLAVSSDGSRIVYSAQPGGLKLRSLSEIEARTLPTEDTALQPFFSPRGDAVAYFDARTRSLRKVHLEGGEPTLLAENIPNGNWGFGVWRDDDTIVYSHEANELSVVTAEGDPLPPIAPSKDGWPRVGRIAMAGNHGDLLLSSKSTLAPGGEQRIEFYDAQSGQCTPILDNAHLAAFTASGHLLFVRDRVLMAATFDVDTLEVGPATPLPQEVERDLGGAEAQLAVAKTGLLVYLVGRPGPLEQAELGWVSRRDGVFTPLIELPPALRGGGLDLSADERSVLVTHNMLGGTAAAFRFDVDRKALMSLDVDARYGLRLHPDPEVPQAVYAGVNGVRRCDIARRTDTVLTDRVKDARDIVYMPDGKTMLFMAERPDFNIYALDDTGEERPVLASSAWELQPTPSPDGHWLAYIYGEKNGQVNVRVAHFPDGGFQQQLTTEGGASPVWRPDGKEMFFMAFVPSRQQWEMRVVSVEADPAGQSIRFGPAQTLFVAAGRGTVANRPYLFIGDGQHYDVSNDGSRFMMLRLPPDRPPPAAELRVVVNWFEWLNRYVPQE